MKKLIGVRVVAGALACVTALALPAIAFAAGAWAIVPSQNSSSTQDNELQGVACTGTFDCWAVGYQATGSGHTSTTQTLTEHRTPTGWVIVNSQNTATGSNALIGVTCVTSTDCWAVGFGSDSSGDQQTLAEHWNGIAWSISATPDVTLENNAATTNQLYGVTCVTTSDCWAVGEYVSSAGDYQGLAEHWNGMSWTLSSFPAASEDLLLFSVACTSSTNCWATGYVCVSGTNTGNCATSSGTQEYAIAKWNGTSWAASVTGTTAGDSALQGVTCASGDCFAVGYQASSSNGASQTLAMSNIGNAGWTMDTSQNTSTSASNVLYGVSCDTAEDCVAVGFAGSPNQTLIEQRTTATPTWTITTSQDANASDNILYGVGCDASGNCAAAGYYDNSGVFQTLVEESTQPGSVLPEAPSAMLLIPVGLAAGLGAWVVRRRTRRPADAGTAPSQV